MASLRHTSSVDGPSGRLVSLDAFRGFTMLFLLAEGTRLYRAVLESTQEGTLLHALATQFTHHPWNGLRFWDLIQPAFMFIVGVALPFAVAKRRQLGLSEARITRHVLYRGLILLLLGVGLHCVYAGRLVWELWNVLAQLAVAYPLAFLLMRFRPHVQIAASVGLLATTELLYRLWPVPGFDQAFVEARNFGSWMDMMLMGKLNPDGWVAINCLPTAAHVIWGVLAGRLLMSTLPPSWKLQRLVGFGATCVILGYALDPVTPIIKRIATSSFVLVSAGWCLLALALFYWLIDVRGSRKWAFPGVVVGMNSIFIYLFGQSVGPQWVNPTVAIFTEGLFRWMRADLLAVFSALVVLALEWGLCYWLYRRRVFIKI